MRHRRAFVAWLSVAAFSACGSNAASQVGPIGGSIGSASGGGGGGGAATGAGGAASDVPAGHCVVVRQLEASGFTQPTRLSDGFAFVPSNPQPQFDCLLLGEDGQSRQASITAPFYPYLTPTVVGTIQTPRFLLFERMGASDSNLELLGQVVREDGTSVAPEGPVLDVFDRGTALYPQAVALDGAHAALGNAHAGIRNPHFVLIDMDGHPASDDISLIDTATIPDFDCFELHGTLHGVVATVADRDAGMFHVVEVDGTGAIVRKVDQPLSSNILCPNITVQGDDVYLVFDGSNGTFEGDSTTLARLDSTGLLPVTDLPAPTPGTYYLWVQGRASDQPLVAIIDGNGASFARLVQDSTLVRLISDGFSGQLIPSADGRLFFQNVTLDPANMGLPTTTITEVRCGNAGN